MGLFRKKEKTDHAIYYVDLTVSDVIRETADAITIVFDHPKESQIAYSPGQFLTLLVTINGKEVRRAYSLCSSPFTDSHLAVTVKRVENGLVSNWLNDNLKKGDTIKVMSPLGTFTPDVGSSLKHHYVLFAGGSGITPMMSIVKSILFKQPQSIISLVYCNRNIDSVIFKNELDKIQNKNEGKLHLIHVLDQAPLNWQGYSGLLTPETLVRLMERIPSWKPEHTSYWMCGPEGMMKNVEAFLLSMNVSKDTIHRESFVQGTIDKAVDKAPESQEERERVVTILYDGEEYKVTVPPGKPILETALDEGIDLPFSCQSGLCTACRGKALSGKVHLDEQEALTEQELAEGYVLTCVGHPLTDDVVIEIG